MASAVGPARRVLPRRWISRADDALVEIEEMRAFPGLDGRLTEQPMQRSFR